MADQVAEETNAGEESAVPAAARPASAERRARPERPALPGARAQVRYARIGPRKARRVIDLVRGMG